MSAERVAGVRKQPGEVGLVYLCARHANRFTVGRYINGVDFAIGMLTDLSVDPTAALFAMNRRLRPADQPCCWAGDAVMEEIYNAWRVQEDYAKIVAERNAGW